MSILHTAHPRFWGWNDCERTYPLTPQILRCIHLLTKSLIFGYYRSYLSASILLATSAIYKSTSQTFFFLFIRSCSRSPRPSRPVSSLQQDTEEAWLRLCVVQAMLQEVLLHRSVQPCWGAGAWYDDDLEPATSGPHDLPPAVELVVEDV